MANAVSHPSLGEPKTVDGGVSDMCAAAPSERNAVDGTGTRPFEIRGQAGITGSLEVKIIGKPKGSLSKKRIR